MAIMRLLFVFLNFASISFGQKTPLECSAAPCPDLRCFSPVVHNGECCPKCRGEPCFYKGQTYVNGETFKELCNTCTCTNERVSCTEMACPKSCFYKGQQYGHGETFKDLCNTCTCTNERVSCTEMACPNSCFYKGQQYGNGETFKDLCNTCTCTNERVSCTKMLCRKSCFHNGKKYKHGETFKDLCNTCFCSDGRVGCTLMACPPKPGQCPTLDPETVGICIEGCTSDYSCLDAKKCCSNGCGVVCTLPKGEFSSKPNCTGVFCPELDCDDLYTPPGGCCEVCPGSMPLV